MTQMGFRRWAARAAAVFVGLVLLTLASAYVYGGTFAINVLLQRNVMIWAKVTPDDPRLSAAMRLALSDQSVAAEPGTFAWRTLAPGFDVAELPVIAKVGEVGAEVDRISLTRVEPGSFRFVVRNEPAGTRNLDAWMHALGAVLVINGSYYTLKGTPDTPLISSGVSSGPAHYVASHGAFAATPASARIHNLGNVDWHIALRGADDALVSFPLLLTPDGGTRVHADRRWLANRSFVGQDHAGRIIFGTTRDAFFSLERLATFLRAAPLDLAMALNLDGGPVASQGVALNGFHRSTCGQWELAVHDGALSLLTPLLRARSRCWEMPIVLAVLPK